MARNNFFFLKNVKNRYLNLLFFSIVESNLLFLKNFKKPRFLNSKHIFIKKINFNKNCINLLFF